MVRFLNAFLFPFYNQQVSCYFFAPHNPKVPGSITWPRYQKIKVIWRQNIRLLSCMVLHTGNTFQKNNFRTKRGLIITEEESLGGLPPPWVSRRIKLRPIRSGGGQSLQKSLNLSGDSSV